METAEHKVESLREKRQWNGTYRDISFEIQNFDFQTPSPYWKSNWTFYLYIDLECLPESVREEFWLRPEYNEGFGRGKFPIYSYSGTVVDDLKWHSGCTWYSKESSVDDIKRIIKIGCDYQHSWDEGQEYDEKLILYDVKKCIDSLHTRIPGIKKRCSYNFQWYDEKDGYENEHGIFFSYEGDRESKEWDKKHRKPSPTPNQD